MPLQPGRAIVPRKEALHAHHAQADVTATAAVLTGMLAAFGLQGADWSELAALCGPVVRSRHIEERAGVPVLAFGKHAGRPLHEIAAGPDRGYLQWLVRQADFPEGVRRICRAALETAHTNSP